MKGYPEPVVEQAIQEARQQADFLYLLIIEANFSILGMVFHDKQSLMLVSGHLRAVGCALDHRVKEAGPISRLRLSLMLVVEDLLIAEEVCWRIRAPGWARGVVSRRTPRTERTNSDGQMLSDCFNQMAADAGEAESDWEQIRTSIQPAVDQQVAGWVDSAQMSMLLAFGKGEGCEPANGLLFR